METILTNPDLLHHIFQYLNFEQHLNITKVCRQFRNVVLDLIYKNKYSKLEVYKTSQGYILSNSIGNDMEMETQGFQIAHENKTLLNNKDFKEFLQLINNKIQKLVLNSTITHSKRFHNGDKKKHNYCTPEDFGISFDNENMFRNITAITFQHIKISEEDLLDLNLNCPKLEKLCLDNCLNINENTLVVGDDIEMNIIENMPVLKSLEILESNHFQDHQLYYEMYEMLTKLNIEQLIINVLPFSLIQGNMKEGDDKKNCTDVYDVQKTNGGCHAQVIETHSNSCKSLQIGQFPSQQSFDKFNSTILNNFGNLQNLTMATSLNSVILINEDFFNTLSKTCQHLKMLRLCNFEITHFIPLYTLNELVMDNCHGLTWQDFKQILSNMKLKSFSSIKIKYVGNFEYFNVSPSLEYFQASRCVGHQLTKLFEMNDGKNFENLSTLVWYDNCTKIPINIAINCLKLTTLIIEPCHLSTNNLYQLEHLEKLVFKAYRNIKFSNILEILKHPTLKYLTLVQLKKDDDLCNFDDDFIDYDVNDEALKEFEDMKTNLLFVNIPYNKDFEKIQDLWLTLLSHNPKLLLMIRYDRKICNNYGFLKKIIFDLKFPSRLQTIKICGYNMELKELREHFNTTTDKLNSFSKQYLFEKQEGYILL